MSWRQFSLPIGIFIAACILLYSFLQYLNRYNIPQFEIEHLCLNEEWIMLLQKEQFIKARQEIIGSEMIGGFQGDDLDFYKRTFGMTEVKIHSKKKRKLETLAYYHIWKNANSNIQSLLMQYLYTADNNTAAYYSQKCRTENCVHKHFQTFSPSATRNLYINGKNSRYGFTFTRDPLSRFVSAVNEIEYRSTLSNNSLPLQNKLGSQERVQEFIRMILLTGGSRSLFRDNVKSEILHIYPMIGTYVMADKVEGKPLALYKMENFTSEWERLSKDISVQLLNKIYMERKEKDWRKHNSSADPFHTLVAAKSLFSFASTDAYQR